uniref:SFRICE_009952 n=1 Tax=Spodoptera frugiperda TaxID=7108 RepID=A0A2H1WAY9_SPOFR
MASNYYGAAVYLAGLPERLEKQEKERVTTDFIKIECDSFTRSNRQNIAHRLCPWYAADFSVPAFSSLDLLYILAYKSCSSFGRLWRACPVKEHHPYSCRLSQQCRTVYNPLVSLKILRSSSVTITASYTSNISSSVSMYWHMIATHANSMLRVFGSERHISYGAYSFNKLSVSYVVDVYFSRTICLVQEV